MSLRSERIWGIFHCLQISEFHLILLYCTMFSILKLKIIYFIVIRTLATLRSKFASSCGHIWGFHCFFLSFKFTRKFTVISFHKHIAVQCSDISIVCSIVYLTSYSLLINVLKSGYALFTALFIWILISAYQCVWNCSLKFVNNL